MKLVMVCVAICKLTGLSRPATLPLEEPQALPSAYLQRTVVVVVVVVGAH